MDAHVPPPDAAWQQQHPDWRSWEHDDPRFRGKPAPPPRMRLLIPRQCKDARPPPYVVKGLISRGDVALLVGAPGAAKSVLAPHVGYAVAQGREVFGRRVAQGPILYLAAEDGHGMQTRVRALFDRWGDTADFHLAPDPLDLLDPDSLNHEQVEQAIYRFAPTLIIIDTLARAFPGLRENDADGMGAVVRVARHLTTFCHSAVLLAHHMPKDGTGPRGHGALAGDADVIMVIDGSGRDARTVRLTKNRNGPSDATLTFNVAVQPLGEDDDGDPVTAPIAEEAPTVRADATRAKEAKQKPERIAMLRELRSIAATAGELYQPVAGSVDVTAVTRNLLRKHLIAAGWFFEAMLRNAPDGNTTLERSGYSKESHALTSLKVAGLLGFNRDWVWLL